MAQDSSSTLQAGQTGLIVRIPEAEPAVGAWRERLDPSARSGVPAHVTVLFPFLHEDLIDAHIRAAIADPLGSYPAFDVRFETFGRFPGILYLAPESDGQRQFLQLTHAVADRWPEVPPFEGRFAELVPHLTVAQSQEAEVLDEVEAALTGILPIAARVSSVELMVTDGRTWRQRASFALRG
ncbi:2'-5' RNA ligase [Kitasatospora sp. MAP12-15]|uniref:2'-5' RNA ligase family protein n=1 Tax=unclassified Kitasatospora TaxID=2633591 RepID=UPI002475110B|nr:2'-5' RNA ligase family protein [Kitasatospora sp. MAP12-44]MDH6113878.1 2'-5' RNA ligase [Kitasatospora sp. MAP12-44]